MKILFAIKSLNNAVGGAERVLCMVASGLSERGHDVSILTFDGDEGQSFYPLSENVRRINLNIGRAQKSAKLFETLRRMRSMRRVVKEENSDIVIGFMHSMFVPLSFCLVGTGTSIIGSEHIVPQHYKTRRFEFFLLVLSSVLLKKITVVSNSVRDLYPRYLKRKIVSIANPVNMPKAGVEQKKSGEDKERFTILNVGRLDPQKDHALLINAFSLIAARYPNWRVKIFGHGALDEKLQEQIKSLNLSDQVLLCGVVDDISKEYLDADIFALSSRYESFGLATAEALAHGLPAVGFSDCPGTNELIKDQQNGVLVQSGASEKERTAKFAHSLECLMGDPQKRAEMSRRAASSVCSYGLGQVVSEWESVIKQNKHS